MSWLLFDILAATYLVLAVVILIRSRTWARRVSYLILISVFPIWYCWDYFVIKATHEEMCVAESGLRVFIEPEKTGRIRLRHHDQIHAEALLGLYSPRLRVVEIMAKQNSNAAGSTYLSYTSVPNPRAGMPVIGSPWGERAYLINPPTAEIETNDPFEIDIEEQNIPNGTTKRMRLVRQATVYATYTTVVHWWSGIRYPDSVPTWRCPNPNAPGHPILGYEPLLLLILK